MKLLKDILYKVKLLQIVGVTDMPVTDITTDSRVVQKGGVFVAVKGSAADGHNYINKAIALGASVVICENLPAAIVDGVTYVQTNDTQYAAGVMAHSFYDEPTRKLKLVGVTGTNGKTTVATLLFQLYEHMGVQCGLISTVQNQIGNKIIPSTHTTPNAVALNQLLAHMVQEGCTHVFMEVSSHAVVQHRIAGLNFAAGIFTNITHDHLDYHGTFDNYIKAKKGFFDGLNADAVAITNTDDKRGVVMLQNTSAKQYSYSLQSMANYKGKILENGLSGLQMTINGVEVGFKMIGEFNAYNLLAVYATACELGTNSAEVLQVLSTLQGAEGRFDYSVSDKEGIIGIVDYAHTPDALQNVLATIKKLNQHNKQIITVVGCGGDRDKTKRPIMAAVACEYSTKAIFTADNPRTEDPAEILNDMTNELKSAYQRKYLSIPDRKEAIKTAVSMSGKGDIVLVAGKGHEKYQEIKGVKNIFDDKQVLAEMFELFDK
jgi:UDP-N-acetylmuramoyl-L-alanyl-D-glutamate--2,6-diaminopimelate ligase